MSQTHMVSTYRPSTITPVHRSCSRPPSDTRDSLSRVDSPSSATACPEGSTGRSRLCRRSEGSRTRHGPHERTLEPKAHARPSMWRPCSPDGEVCIGPRPPLVTFDVRQSRMRRRCDLTGLPELGYIRPVARGTSEWFGSGGETSRVR